MHTHQFGNERTLSHLRGYLPYSLPLYRRIQSRHRSDDAQIIASFPQDEDALEAGSRNTCFVLAFADRSVRPETETWFFAPGEAPSHERTGAECTCFREIQALINHISNMPIPNPSQATASNNPLSSHHASQSIMLCGAVASVWGQKLQAASLLWSEYPSLARPCALITLDKDAVAEHTQPVLPAGVRLGNISRPEDFELVRSRSEIPRRVSTLRALPSKALFHAAGDRSGERLIAWAFLGTDLSLSTLHVEPEWRRRGLGSMLTAALVVESSGEEGVSHSYVFQSNAPSLAMFEKLGGSTLGECYWVRLDLSKAQGNS
jgi:hypothetical protein